MYERCYMNEARLCAEYLRQALFPMMSNISALYTLYICMYAIDGQMIDSAYVCMHAYRQ